MSASCQRQPVSEQTVAASGINPIYSQTEKSVKVIDIEEDIYSEVPKRVSKEKRRDLKECSWICCLFLCPSLAITCICLSTTLNILLAVGTLSPSHLDEEVQDLRATLESLQERVKNQTKEVNVTVVDYNSCVEGRTQFYMNISKTYQFEAEQIPLPHYVSESEEEPGLVSYSFVFRPHIGNKSSLQLSPVYISKKITSVTIRHVLYSVRGAFADGSSGYGQLYYTFCPFRDILVYKT